MTLDSAARSYDITNLNDKRILMCRAITLATRGQGIVGRPHVGALVLSAQGQLIGEGWKQLINGTSLVMHAERNALNQADGAARGGTLITTLEPCVHDPHRYHMLSSCASLIEEYGIKQVVVGGLERDAFRNTGVHYLETHGIHVVVFDEYADFTHKLCCSFRRPSGYQSLTPSTPGPL